jgi:hypothetical protein
LTTPAGPLSVIVAPGTTALLSSITCPRKEAVCAHSGKDTTRRTRGKKDNFILNLDRQISGNQ